jgi:hypothetical protein
MAPIVLQFTNVTFQLCKQPSVGVGDESLNIKTRDVLTDRMLQGEVTDVEQ